MNSKYRTTLTRAGVACLVALVLVAIVHQVGVAVDNTDLAVRSRDGQGFESVTLAMSLAATVVVTIVSLGLALLLQRWRNARRNWLIVTVTIALASVLSPILTAQQASGAVWLVILHIVVAGTVIPSIASTLETGPRSGTDRTSDVPV